MVNPRAKGNRIERKAKNLLNDAGYRTARMQHTRYGDNDFFNLYDITAVQPGKPVKFIQVKSNQQPNLQEFKKETLETVGLEAQVEIWTHYDRKGWEIRRLNRMNKEWETLVDERNADSTIGTEVKKHFQKS